MCWEMENYPKRLNFPFLIMVINNQNLMIKIRAFQNFRRLNMKIIKNIEKKYSKKT